LSFTLPLVHFFLPDDDEEEAALAIYSLVFFYPVDGYLPILFI